MEGAIGCVRIADEVVMKIAGTSALEAEGVAGARGVKVTVEGGLASVEMSLLVKFGAKIKTVTEDVQRRVKNAVETMTGLDVASVDLAVAGVVEGSRGK
jgi:uncharacterized alkaline shock family protein YloU